MIMSDSLDDMQKFVTEEIAYLFKGVSNVTVEAPDLIEEVEDDYRSLVFKVHIKDIETTHKSSILIEVNYEEQEYFIIFGEDNQVACTDVNLWQSLFFNKEDSEDSKNSINNLEKIISKSQDGVAELKGAPKISKGWN
jgi:hypothetical protein